MFLISNTVIMGISIRKEEIFIMRYVGATDYFVRAPFVIECLIIGLIGAGIPLGIIYLIYDKAIVMIMERFSVLSDILNFLPLQTVFNVLVPMLLILGGGIGFFGSVITVRKHLKV